MNLKNSLYKITPSAFNKEMRLPSSKSHANRALIIGAIRGNGFRVDNVSTSSDVNTMLSCLEVVGIKLIRSQNSVTFLNSFPACEIETSKEVVDLKSGDGGTTNRFLMALLSLGKKTYRFFPSEKMSERPINDLLSPLKDLNVKIDLNKNEAWVELTGPVQLNKVKKIVIDCNESTQFASAMLLTFSNLPLEFELKNIRASEAYITMTKAILLAVKDSTTYEVPVDFSSLSYPVALALLNGSVLIKNCLAVDLLQADSKFIELMQKVGGDIEWTKAGLRASSQNTLLPFEVDGAQFPDLIPTLAFIAAHVEGESVLSNLSVLRHKESDRIEEILSILKNLGIDFQFIPNRDEIRIKGRVTKYAEATIVPARDHRMVMTGYLFLRKNSGGWLAHRDCIDKSFPDFFNVME